MNILYFVPLGTPKAKFKNWWFYDILFHFVEQNRIQNNSKRTNFYGTIPQNTTLQRVSQFYSIKIDTP